MSHVVVVVVVVVVVAVVVSLLSLVVPSVPSMPLLLVVLVASVMAMPLVTQGLLAPQRRDAAVITGPKSSTSPVPFVTRPSARGRPAGLTVGCHGVLLSRRVPVTRRARASSRC